MEIDPEKLLLDLSDGKELEPEILEELLAVVNSVDARALGRLPSVDQIYSCLVVLRRLGDHRYAHVLEKFLDAEDCLTVSLILEALCLDWGLTESYLEHVIKFALGVDWDDGSDVRETALKVLGEFLHTANIEALRSRKSKHVLPVKQYRVLELLYFVFQDTDNDDWTRQVAYCSILRAFGTAFEALPSECAILELSEESQDLDQDVLSRCRELLALQPVERTAKSKQAFSKN